MHRILTRGPPSTLGRRPHQVTAARREVLPRRTAAAHPPLAEDRGPRRRRHRPHGRHQAGKAPQSPGPFHDLPRHSHRCPAARTRQACTNSAGPVFPAPAPPAARQPAAAGDAAWIPAGQPAYAGGLVYAGSGLAAEKGGMPEPALIDPGLPVDQRAPDYAGTKMGYWPSYSSIPPDCRAAYLHWLLDGRRAPGAHIGYVFLYFYGLERRLLVDSQRSPAARAEHPTLVREVERLLRIYGANGSFSGYAGNLLRFLSLSGGPRRYLSAPPPARQE